MKEFFQVSARKLTIFEGDLTTPAIFFDAKYKDIEAASVFALL